MKTNYVRSYQYRLSNGVYSTFQLQFVYHEIAYQSIYPTFTEIIINT